VRLRCNSNLFLSASLDAFVRLFHDTAQNPPAARALFSSAAEVLPYESLWQSIFRDVLESYPQRSARFQSLAAQADQRQSLIRNTRERLAASFISPILDIATVRGGMKQPIYVPSPNRRGQSDLDPNQEGYLVFLYFDIRNRLDALQALPCFISFYQLLFSSLSHRITEEQAREFSVPAAIAYLERCFDAEHVHAACTTLRESWQTFKKTWNFVAEKVRNLRLCPNAAAFEGEVHPVSDETTVLSVVSAKSASTGELQLGSIAQLVKDLLDTQRDIVEAAQAAALGGATTGETLDLSILAQSGDFSLLLFGSDFTDAQFDSYASCCADVDEVWQASSLSVNVRRLEEFLAARAVGKGRDFDLSRLSMQFPFALVELAKSDQDVESGAPLADLMDIDASVCKLLMRYCTAGKLAFLGTQIPLSEVEERQLDLLLKASSQNDLNVVGRAMLRMLKELKSLYDDEFMLPNGGKSLLDTYQVMSGGEAPPELLTKFRITMDKLRSFINWTCIHWLGKDVDMFTDVPAMFGTLEKAHFGVYRSNFPGRLFLAAALPDNVASSLNRLQAIIITETSAADSHKLQDLLSFSSELYRIVSDRKSIDVRLKPAFLANSIADFISHVNKKLPETNPLLFAELVPRSIQFRHYVKYAQRLHAFVAVLREQLIAYNTEAESADTTVIYSEKLPAHIAQIHSRVAQRIIIEDELFRESEDDAGAPSQYYPFDVEHSLSTEEAPKPAEDMPFSLSATPNAIHFESRLQEELYCNLLVLHAIPEAFKILTNFCQRWNSPIDKPILRAHNEASEFNFALAFAESFRAIWCVNAPSKRIAFALKALQHQLSTIYNTECYTFTNLLFGISQISTDGSDALAESPIKCVAQLKTALLVGVNWNHSCRNSTSQDSIISAFNYSLRSDMLQLSVSDLHSLVVPCRACGASNTHAEMICREMPAVVICCLPLNHVAGVNRLQVPENLWMREEHANVKLPSAAGYRLVGFCVRSAQETISFSS
jgi:hypothetical protein